MLTIAGGIILAVVILALIPLLFEPEFWVFLGKALLWAIGFCVVAYMLLLKVAS